MFLVPTLGQVKFFVDFIYRHMKFLEALNNEFYPLRNLERINLVADRFDRILVTSSFGTTSAVLLHLLSQSKLAHLPVFIVNTKEYDCS